MSEQKITGKKRAREESDDTKRAMFNAYHNQLYHTIKNRIDTIGPSFEKLIKRKKLELADLVIKNISWIPDLHTSRMCSVIKWRCRRIKNYAKTIVQMDVVKKLESLHKNLRNIEYFPGVERSNNISIFAGALPGAITKYINEMKKLLNDIKKDEKNIIKKKIIDVIGSSNTNEKETEELIVKAVDSISFSERAKKLDEFLEKVNKELK